MYGTFATASEQKAAAESTMDLYAKLARDNGLYNKESVDSYLFDAAVMLAAGNVVEYEDRQIMLPNNELTAESFEDWIQYLEPSYIDTLGGVDGIDNSVFVKGIADGDIQMRPSGVRGEYYLTDATGMFVRSSETDTPFVFKYDKNAPRRLKQSRSQKRQRARK